MGRVVVALRPGMYTTRGEESRGERERRVGVRGEGRGEK
jgi:hypothetical protein